MDNNQFTSFPAFVWTGKQIIDAFASIPIDFSPFEDALNSAKTLFAMLTNVETKSIRFLSNLFETNKDLNGCIIICLPKGCLTNQPNLKLLTDLEKQYSSKINIKIFLLNSREDILSSIFLINTFDDKIVLSLGDFIRDASYSINNSIKRNNLVFTPQNELAEVVYTWYDYLWLDQTIPLDEFILNGFSRVSSSIANKNEEKTSSNEPTNTREDSNKLVETTATVTIKNIAKELPIAPTKFLNLPRLDPFALKIAKIYEQGEIITLDRKNRFPPLEVPIKAEWLSIKGSEKIGDLTQEIKYRILAIDEGLLKQIEQKKNVLRELVHNFTFSMGETLRWMPLKAKPLFDKELDRVNKEVKDFIQTVLGNNISEYLDKRKNKIEEDARKIQSNFVKKTTENSIYRTPLKEDKLAQLDLFMEEDSSQQTLLREEKENQSDSAREKVYIEKILNEITKRLTKVKECNFIPSISYNKISFNYSESKWSSPWLQASRFLTSIAEFSRKGTYEVFLKHTPSIDYKQYIQAMNVCDDALIRLLGSNHFSYAQKQSLVRLQHLLETEIEMHSTEGERLCNKCKELFDLMSYL